MLLHRETTQAVIDAFFVTYNRLGYGFTEGIYMNALQHELRKAGRDVLREVNLLVPYDEIVVGRCRVDMLVDKVVVVEGKAGARLDHGVEGQVFNYLRSTNLEVGLLLHYGPRPVFKRYLCTNDRKTGFDLRQGNVSEVDVPGC